MQDTFNIPPGSRAEERSSEVDDALVAAARRVLVDLIESLPVATSTHRHGDAPRFASGVRTLCLDSRRAGVPVEKLIIALKKAWVSAPQVRRHLGESSSDALTAMVTECIERYFLLDPGARAD